MCRSAPDSGQRVCRGAVSVKAVLFLVAVGAVSVIIVLLTANPGDRNDSLTSSPGPRTGDVFSDPSPLPSPMSRERPATVMAGGVEVPVPEGSSLSVLTTPGEERTSEESDPVTNERLHVRVVDELGSPVAEARVEVWEKEYNVDVPPLAAVLSEPNGLAWITIPRQTSEVLVSKDGVGTSGIWTAKSAPRELQDEAIIQLRPTGRIMGQVLWTDGLPEAGAEVTFAKSSGGARGTRARWPAAQTTDADGRFEVEVDTPLYAWVTASARERASPLQIVGLQPGDLEDVLIKLPAFEIEGRVVDASGEPVIATKVEAANVTKPGIAGTVNEDGTFSIELSEPATYDVRVEAEGLVQDQHVAAQVDAVAPAAHVDVKLVPETKLSGTVRWSSGESFGYAYISAWPQSDRRAEGEPHWQTYRAVTHSEMDGRFILGGLHPDLSYCLDVTQMMGEKLAVVQDVLPGTSGLIITVEGPLPRSVTLTGTVRDARTGAPLSRFETTAFEFDHFGYSPVTRAVAWHDDPQGRFEIADLNTNGTYVVLVKADDYAPLNHGPVMLGTAPGPLTLSMGRWGGLRVRVADDFGDPVPGGSIKLWPDFPRERGEAQKPMRTADADSSGLAVWSELAPGSYWLEGATERLSGGPMRVTVPNESTAEATLVLSDAQEPGGVDVTLLDFDGTPAAQQEVRVARMRGTPDEPLAEPQLWTCRTDARGAFKQAVPPGSYSVVSSRFGTFAFSGRVFVPAGEWVRVELRLK